VRSALLAEDRRGRERGSDALENQILARAIGVGNQIVRTLLRDLARIIDPLAEQRAGVARKVDDERERVQGSPPRKRCG
jgi:hypothetical protein